MLDGYTTFKQMFATGRHFWLQPKDHGVHLRDYVAFLLFHFAWMRGDSARKMELPDLHGLKHKRERFTE